MCKLCSANITNCVECSSGTVCTKCSSNYYLLTEGDSTSCSECNTIITRYRNGATDGTGLCSLCTVANSDCLECNYTDATICTKCTANYYIIVQLGDNNLDDSDLTTCSQTCTEDVNYVQDPQNLASGTRRKIL